MGQEARGEKRESDFQRAGASGLLQSLKTGVKHPSGPQKVGLEARNMKFESLCGVLFNGSSQPSAQAQAISFPIVSTQNTSQ